jgi:hypothetical protein
MAEFSFNDNAPVPKATMDYSANWDTLAESLTMRNTDSMESGPPKKEPLIQRFVYRYLQFTGFYPRSIDQCVLNNKALRSGKPLVNFPINAGLVLLSVGLTLLGALGLLSLTIQKWDFNKKQMQKLEFFTMINFIFTIFELVQAPLTLFVMVWKSQKLVPLITAVEDFLHKVNQIQKKRLIIALMNIGPSDGQ